MSSYAYDYVKHISKAVGKVISKRICPKLNDRIDINKHIVRDILPRRHISDLDATVWDTDEDFEALFDKLTIYILTIIKSDLACFIMSLQDGEFPYDTAVAYVKEAIINGIKEQFKKQFNLIGFDVELDDGESDISQPQLLMYRAIVSKTNDTGRGDIAEIYETHYIDTMLNNTIRELKVAKEVYESEVEEE
jgi:hypothetical protein